MRHALRRALPGLIVLVLAACTALPAPTATATPIAPRTASPAPGTTAPGTTATGTASAASTASAEPTATPEPPLSLDPPDETDPRVVSVGVAPNVGDEGGEILVSVTSLADERIDELVLRWPTELNETLFLAPFEPSEERIREGGDPLVQPWTKWVIGPGEQGEPAGTISLGWGPLLAGATLDIKIVVDRRVAGPVAFDLQVLARNDLLTLEGGEPAELRVEVP